MKKKLVLILFFILMACSSYAVDLFVPASVKQGGVITVFVKGGEEGLKISLSKGDKFYSNSECFEDNLDGHNVIIGLLGVPSTLPVGTYTVKLEDQTKNIEVIKESFICEDIPLNSHMTSLRQDDGEQRREQARALTKILLKVNKDDVYENGILKKPVTELRITSFYGDRRTYLYDDGTKAKSIHNGIDYSAVPGTSVYAAGEGQIVFAGDRIITGLSVVIEHLPGVYSLYYHLSGIDTELGQSVKKGELIGEVGATGLATGAHLHWEMRVGGVAVKPEPFLSTGIIDKAFILSNM
ncbi:MAG: M23 family metallopeptidase [Spirochaetales bacterium]|nr:M23 family metallopeptidase [Spirochaetales bacterium]